MSEHHYHLSGDLTLLAGSANMPLAQAIAEELGLVLWPAETSRFPDGEAHVQLGATVRDRDVYLVQPTCPPVDGNWIELLLFADACRRAGADRLTAVIPYFGYARQDRRAKGREAIAARVVSDLLGAVRVDRVVALDLHSPSIEGFLPVPLEHLTAVPTIAAALQEERLQDAIIVSPDLPYVETYRVNYVNMTRNTSSTTPRESWAFTAPAAWSACRPKSRSLNRPASSRLSNSRS